MASYQSLYRKHRPQTFAALRGQEHVTAALRNAVKDGRVGHAYLFSGPRGTGKTTTARLLAKALNCLALGSDGEPCDKCENCVAIAEGRFLDLIELDAASNNRVEEMRELLERVPLGLNLASKRKVYVFDEAHMLTGSSSNALLKTLEEPPDHVVFVLATTEPEKLLATIRSRTQHYEFTLFTVEQIVAEMSAVLEREGMPADPEALETIARAAAGSMRDALSLLDQALAHGTGRLDAEPVADLFGRTPFDTRCRILEAVAGEDAAVVLTTLGELLGAGHEPRRIAEDLLRAARDGFLITAGAGRVPLEMPDDQQKRLGELGRALGNPTLVRMLETLGQAVVDMRGSDAADPRLVLEIALVRLTRRDAGPPLQTVVDRIERLERAVDDMKNGASAALPPTGATASGASTPGATAPGRTVGAIRREAAAAPTQPEPPAMVEEPEGLPSTDEGAGSPGPRQPELRGSGERPDGPGARPEEPEGLPSTDEGAGFPGPRQPELRGTASDPLRPGARPEELDLDDVIVAWAAILPELPVATRSSVQEAQPLGVEGDVITFGVPPRLFEAASPRFRREADTIRSALSERLGRTVRFTLVSHEGFAGGAPERAPASAPPATVDLAAEEADEEADEEPPVDPHELVDAAPDAAPGEPMQMLTNDLGATVVEERPRGE